MKHFKEIKDSRGIFKVEVSLWNSTHEWETDINGNHFRYDVYTSFIPKGKRKPIDNNNHTHLLSEEDIHGCKVEFWEKIKP